MSGPTGRAAEAMPAREAAGDEARRDGSAFGHARELVGTLLLAFAIAFACRAFVIEPFLIPSGSMLPTLWIGDHLFVDKFAYGAQIPLTSWRLPALRDPARGEVVVFSVAKDGERIVPADRAPALPREDFVKRIIGLPGDRIDIVAGVVFVNGDPLPIRRTGAHFRDDFGRDFEVQEVKVGEREFEVLHDPERTSGRAHFEVEEGRYFMLGDNRDWSKDSREWGTVRREEIKGPAFLLYWSWSFTGSWHELLDASTWGHTDVRWDRVGSRVR